jgi:hypothetical protein
MFGGGAGTSRACVMISGAMGVPFQGYPYARTIRTYDWTLAAWRVDFIDPAAPETNARLIARRRGSIIEIEAKLSDATPIRWRYESITPTSYHYNAEKIGKDGASSLLYLKLSGTRTVS